MAREMKDSGIEWIGEIPREWEVAQLKRFINVNNGREIETEVQDTNGAIPVYGSGGVFKYTNIPLFDGETVMFGRKGTLGKPIYANEKLWTVDTMYFLTFSDDIFAKFNYYQLVSFDWNPHITQTALPSVVGSEIVSCHFAFPPFSEQQSIAVFLDTQCAHIDSVIEKTHTAIEEYKKLKQFVITQAVTKGIRPNREMKDSGIEWIGEIPKKWICTIMKRFCRFQTGSTPSTNNPQWFDGNLDWFTPSDFNEKCFLSNSIRKLSKKAKEDGVATLIEPNTVMIIGIGGTAGKIGFTTSECSCNQQITAVKPNNELLSKYLMYWMISNTKILKDTALYTTLPIINNQTIGEFLLIMPETISEQSEIVAYLDEKTAAIDSLIQKKEQLITELEAYKKSLIYEYVTGKKEVPVHAH